MQTTGLKRTISALALAVLIAACDEDSTGPARLARSYVLVEAAGRPVPAILQVHGNPQGDRTENRLVARSLEFGPGTQVVYSRMDDALVISNANADTTVLIDCSNETATVSRVGDLVILQFGSPGFPGRIDTLRLEGRQLVDSIATGVGVQSPIRYSPGEPAEPVCDVS